MTSPMFDMVRRLKLVFAFVGARRADYVELAAIEWAQLSTSLLRLVCGGVVASLSALFFLGFLSLAAIVSAWDSDWRIATAWLVAGAWLVLGGAGGAVVWLASRRLRPFEHVRDELSQDIAVVRSVF